VSDRLSGLDLVGRAALLGIGCRELVALATEDPRITAPAATATEGAIVRLRRWLDAGRPDANATEVDFHGDDAVRAIVVEVLGALPTPVRWHGTRAVTWYEVGRSAIGWMSIAPLPLVPAGDVGHAIVLSGMLDDARLPAVIAHELGHSWHRHVHTAPVRAVPPVSQREWTARLLLVEEIMAPDGQGAKRLAHRRHVEERLADETALAWGYRLPPGSSDHTRLAGFRAEIADAAALKLEDEGTP
jgi:hypothetical protein